jgi:dihydroflavonol-4-reductase
MILVAGGNGFVGMHLVQTLAAQGHSLIATYRQQIPNVSIKGVQWLQCDILDVAAIDLIIAGCTQVYLCANAVSFDSNDAKNLMHSNVQGTANIVNACIQHKVNKLLYISSVAAINRQGNDVITEDTPFVNTKEMSAYAKSKYYAELEVWRGIAEGLCAAIINPSIILGEGNWHNSSCALFKNVYNQFPFYTKGVNGYVDVQNVVSAMLQLMNSEIHSQRFIVSQGNYTYQQIFTLMAQAMHKKPPHILAKPWMNAIAWRWYWLKSKFTGKPALITAETVHTAQSTYKYDGDKIIKALPTFRYTPIEQCIARCGYYYTNKHNKFYSNE